MRSRFLPINELKTHQRRILSMLIETETAALVKG
jgi:hypothetical protein